MAAKQGTTIDHISTGRFALNVVCGWFDSEFRMFGAPVMEHDRLYESAAEWLELVIRLWTEEAQGMAGWHTQVKPDLPLDQQADLWKWVADNVDFRVRAANLF